MPAAVQHSDFDSYVHAGWVWHVNGKRASKRKEVRLQELFESDEAMDRIHSPWSQATLCEYCQTPMDTPSFRHENLEEDDGRVDLKDEWRLDRIYSLAHCPYCCHWKFRANEGTNKCMDAPTNVIAESVARKFDQSLPEGCTTELAVQLRQNSSLWHSVEPKRMERLVADLFRANYQHVEVIHVGKPGDLGVDVFFVDGGNAEWLIQVKRRESPEAVEGFETLQRLLGTLVLEGKLRGIIATTAKGFSRQLLKQKRRAESSGFTIQLLDRGKLNRMLSPVLPKRPWLELMKEVFFWGLDAEVRGYFIDKTTVPGESLFDIPPRIE